MELGYNCEAENNDGGATDPDGGYELNDEKETGEEGCPGLVDKEFEVGSERAVCSLEYLESVCQTFCQLCAKREHAGCRDATLIHSHSVTEVACKVRLARRETNHAAVAGKPKG